MLAEARAQPDAARLTAAREAAHTLKGSSGSYGFGAACRELQLMEDTLRRCEAGGQALADAWPSLEQALARARASLAAAP